MERSKKPDPSAFPAGKVLKAATLRAAADRENGPHERASLPPAQEGVRRHGAESPARERVGPAGPRRPSPGLAGRGGVAPRMLSARAVRVAGLGRRRKHREPSHGAGGERPPWGRWAAGRGRGSGVRALALGPGAAVAADGRGRPLPAPVARALQVSARGARRGGRAHGWGWRGGVPGPRSAPHAVGDRVERAGVAAASRAPPWGLSSSGDTCASF